MTMLQREIRATVTSYARANAIARRYGSTGERSQAALSPCALPLPNELAMTIA